MFVENIRFTIVNNTLNLKFKIDNLLNNNNMETIGDIYDLSLGDLKNISTFDLYKDGE